MKTLADIIAIPQSNIKHLFEDWWVYATKPDLRGSMRKYELLEKEEDRIISLLPDLSKFKLKIFEFTEFDMISYHIEKRDYKISVAYRPKNIAVSFWTASFKDCEIIKEIKS